MSRNNDDYSDRSSNTNNNNDDDKEFGKSSNIQKLYQQVQNEDSEWFYQTFSKLLVLDNSNNNNIINDNAVVRAAIDEKKERTNTVGGNIMTKRNGKEERREDNNRLMMEKDNEEEIAQDVTENTAAAAVDEAIIGKRETIIAATNTIYAEKDLHTIKINSSKSRREIALMQQQQRIRQNTDEEDYEEETDYRSVAAASSNDKVQERKDEYKVEIEDEVEYESLNKEVSNNNNADETSKQPSLRVKTPKAQLSSNKGDDDHTSNYSSPSLLPNDNIIRLRNIYNNEIENIGYLTPILALGYTTKEILVLKPQVLELILDDKIVKPKKGLPKRWVRLSKLDGYNNKKDDDGGGEEEVDDEDFEWDVEVVSGTLMDDKKSYNKEQEFIVAKKESADAAAVSIPNEESQLKSLFEIGNKKQRQQSITEEDDYNGDDTRRNSSRGSVDTTTRRSKPIKKLNDEYSKNITSRRRTVDDTDNEKRRQKKRMQQQHRPSLSQRRELRIDRGVDDYNDDDNVGAGNKFWMDLPTFRDFLRKEAKFRLQILGPDWKESVLDESKWRYDLYKTWLAMLDDGVGDNPLYEYGDSPRPRRRNSSSPAPPMPQPRSRGEQRNRRRTRIEDDEEEDDYNNNERDRPNNRRESRFDTIRDGNRNRKEGQSSINQRPSRSSPASSWKNEEEVNIN